MTVTQLFKWIISKVYLLFGVVLFVSAAATPIVAKFLGMKYEYFGSFANERGPMALGVSTFLFCLLFIIGGITCFVRCDTIISEIKKENTSKEGK